MRGLTVGRPGDIDRAAIVRVARDAVVPRLDGRLLADLDQRRARMLAALDAGGPVYGVTTGMGAFSEQPLDASAQVVHQDRLLLARAVGAAPWLEPDEVRAVLAVRLRTLLNGDSSISAAVCRRLADLIAAGVLPAVPRTAMGTAGEVIALAHLAAPITGDGAVLGDDGDAVPARPILAAAGLEPLALGPKEGVALIEGVPVTTALAILRARDARAAITLATRAFAAELALTGAARDCLHPAFARGDDVLAEVTTELRRLAGSAAEPRALQPPVSFRVSAQVLAHAHRALAALEAAVDRALDGVTDSPVFVESGGQFLGTAGFSGYDLACHLQAMTVALLGVAEVAAARLHRLLDPRISGLSAQLSAAFGAQSGLVAVHKRAVGVVHALRRSALPATVGTVETSAGQEDVQSFSLEAAEALRDSDAGLVDVVACELLAIHQMRCLGARPPDDAAVELIGELAVLLPGAAEDRAWGVDLQTLRRWAAAR